MFFFNDYYFNTVMCDKQAISEIFFVEHLYFSIFKLLFFHKFVILCVKFIDGRMFLRQAELFTRSSPHTVSKIKQKRGIFNGSFL